MAPLPLRRVRKRRRVSRRAAALENAESSLLDVVDNLLNHGVVVDGEVTLGVAGVDLVYLRLSVLLSAADRVAGLRAGGSRT
jgi:hypothetical protein